MKTLMLAGAMALLSLAPSGALGQDGDTAIAYAYVTYFKCNTAEEYRADEIIARSYKPHYDAAVEAGDISQWGWLAHFVGGEWRRALILSAGNMEDLLAAAGALGEAILASTPEAGRVFTEVCPDHEDYIWQTVPGASGSALGAERGAVGFTTYMVCDINREERADEIIRETLGPVYDAQVEAGNLVGWNWLAHDVGGEWRRLLSLTASDHDTMMRTRDEIVTEMRQGRLRRAFEQLNDICPTHQDLMWDIQLETP